MRIRIKSNGWDSKMGRGGWTDKTLHCIRAIAVYFILKAACTVCVELDLDF